MITRECRRACSTLGADRVSVGYQSRRANDATAHARLRALVCVRGQFGYRPLYILLKRERIIMNHKKLRRLYREERLQVRRRGGRKRALGTMVLPQGPNQRGAWTSYRTRHDASLTKGVENSSTSIEFNRSA